MERFIHTSSLYGSRPFANTLSAFTILLVTSVLVNNSLSELFFKDIYAIPNQLALPLYFFIVLLLLAGLTDYNIQQMRKDAKVTTIKLLPQRIIVKVSLLSFYHVVLPIIAMIFLIQFKHPTILTTDGLYVLGALTLGTFFTLKSLSRPTQSMKQAGIRWVNDTGLIFIVSAAFYLNDWLVLVSLACISIGIYHYANVIFLAKKKTHRPVKNRNESTWLVRLIKKQYRKVNLVIHYDRQFFLHPVREVAAFTGQLIVIMGLIMIVMFQEALPTNYLSINPQVITWWITVFAFFFIILNLSHIKATDVALLPFKPFERWSLLTGYRHLKIVLLSAVAVFVVLTVTHVGFRLFYLFNSHLIYEVNVTYTHFLMTGFESYFVALIYVLGLYHVTLTLYHLFLLLTRNVKLYLKMTFNKKSQLGITYIIVFPVFLYDYISNVRFLTNTIDLMYVFLIVIVSLLIDYYAYRKLEVVTS
ncbi:hypothetical protein SAMN05421839_10551 [Halolactibacillus halophilus]|uniref:Uncharacterized protein n=1 Tax=Halolactibacillus halophilus TaxID=306540 RepID=A0A1I5MEH3_9BACI|nr:hypothetical protein [Halolactibacillus halophilus]GEM02479.1 hypothetical protein HHA03_20110 [Halolactibacillus halophilus]SFP07933.1 hypothetical protein SAMN05421839_10551 [Halolactibacillus halophilus]